MKMSISHVESSPQMIAVVKILTRVSVWIAIFTTCKFHDKKGSHRGPAL